MWLQLLQIQASSPVCVGAVGAVMIAIVVCGLTSLLLEDAAVSTVEFCCTEAVSALPLTNWLRFFWAAWRSVMVLGAVGVGWAVSSLGICCRNRVKKIVGLNDVRDTEQQRADFMQNLGNLQGSCIIHFSRFIFLCNLYVGSTTLPLHSCLTARMRVGIYLF